MNKIDPPEFPEIIEIQNIVKDIFYLFDAQEWGKFRSLFMDEVAFDVESSSGVISAKYFTDDLVTLWKTKINNVRKSYHQLSNPTVELDDNTASVSTKTYNFQRLEGTDEEGFWELWVNFIHQLVKTADGWKCIGIKMFVPLKSEDHDMREFFP